MDIAKIKELQALCGALGEKLTAQGCPFIVLCGVPETTATIRMSNGLTGPDVKINFTSLFIEYLETIDEKIATRDGRN